MAKIIKNSNAPITTKYTHFKVGEVILSYSANFGQDIDNINTIGQNIDNWLNIVAIRFVSNPKFILIYVDICTPKYTAHSMVSYLIEKNQVIKKLRKFRKN